MTAKHHDSGDAIAFTGPPTQGDAPDAEEGRNPTLAIRAAVVCLILMALIGISYGVLTATEWGRARLAEGVAAGLSSAIPGSVEVGGVERATWKQLEVTGLVFNDPNGDPVLSLDEAKLKIGRSALLSGDVEIPEADVRGGTLRIEEQPDGSVRLEQAFSSSGGSGGGSSGLDLSIKNVRVRDLEVVIALSGGPTLRVKNVHALLRIELRPEQGVEVVFDQVNGTLTEGLPIGDVELDRIEGRVRGKAEHVLSIEGPARAHGDEFGLHIDYYDRTDKPVVVRLSDLDLSVLGLAAVGADIATELALPNVEIELGDEESE